MEQDTCNGDPYESLKISYDYLTAKGFCCAEAYCNHRLCTIGILHAKALSDVKNARLHSTLSADRIGFSS